MRNRQQQVRVRYFTFFFPTPFLERPSNNNMDGSADLNPLPFCISQHNRHQRALENLLGVNGGIIANFPSARLEISVLNGNYSNSFARVSLR